jgi:hypothetical protein
MSYSPPSFSSVNFNFTVSYTPPSPSSVDIEFLSGGSSTLVLNSSTYTLVYSPVTYSRTYQAVQNTSNTSLTLSPLTMGKGYILPIDSLTLSSALGEIVYDKTIRNLTSSYSLVLSPLSLSVAKVPLVLDSCSTAASLSSVGLLYNRAIALSTPYTLSLSNTTLSYVPVSALLQLESSSYSLSAGNIAFFRTHAPLVLSSSSVAVSGGTVGYLYNRSLNLLTKNIASSTSLEEKVDRLLSLVKADYFVDSPSGIDLLVNSKLNLVGSLGTLSFNNTPLLHNRNIDISSLSLSATLSPITPIRTRIYNIESIGYVTTLNDIEYKNYSLSLSPLSFTILLSPIPFNYLRSTLSIQTLPFSSTFNDVGLLLTKSLPLELVNVLVISGTSVLATEDIKVIDTGITNAIELNDKCSIFETTSTNIISTPPKVILINTTKAN